MHSFYDFSRDEVLRRRYDLILIALVALLVRLLYFALATGHMGLEAFSTFAPDSQFYHYVADHILGGHPRGPSVMLMVGPGYGLILAVLKLILGPSLVYPILFNIVLGTAAALFVYGIAGRLVGIRIVSIAAGLTSALSMTSIVISTHILTDQPLFTLYAAALYCFVRGYQGNSRGWFVTAGALAGFSAYVRGSGQLAVLAFVLLMLVLPLQPIYHNRWQLIRRAGLAVLTSVLLIAGWSTRNLVVEEHFVFSTIGMLTMRHCLAAQALAEDDAKLIQKYRSEWGAADGESDPERYRGAYSRAKVRVAEAWNEMPGRLMYYFMFNVTINARAPNDYVRIQVPMLAPAMNKINAAIWYFWGLGLALLALAGVVLLAFSGRAAAAWILGSHYVTFTLFCGSSFWQGSRLHYTAELAWAILVPFTLWTLVMWVGSPVVDLYRRLRSRIGPRRIR